MVYLVVRLVESKKKAIQCSGKKSYLLRHADMNNGDGFERMAEKTDMGKVGSDGRVIVASNTVRWLT